MDCPSILSVLSPFSSSSLFSSRLTFTTSCSLTWDRPHYLQSTSVSPLPLSPLSLFSLVNRCPFFYDLSIISLNFWAVEDPQMIQSKRFVNVF